MLCGIDEAGRGCCAGDLVIAGCILDKDIESLNDSKKLTPKKRSEIYKEIVKNSQYHIVVCKSSKVDKLGISLCMSEALREIKQKLNANRYIFDGNTSFGIRDIETMIKADATVPEVSAASILAKVTHDTNIIEASKLYPEYGFEKHKGYLTKYHIEMIKKYGYCDIHRKSYKIKALEKTLF